ncbi:hypothetical protein BpHYR1_044363 [Brachionus plicatilis]|uniref:Uncharacterized protein n=1 Tax=Brachionus plicatilis TaxID=10195 RepID=A0A3M7STB8_BRAPC|nr:hypothetical protein BpHYR1_044363 [Brachionus plicatilis]
MYEFKLGSLNDSYIRSIVFRVPAKRRSLSHKLHIKRTLGDNIFFFINFVINELIIHEIQNLRFIFEILSLKEQQLFKGFAIFETLDPDEGHFCFY